MALVLIVVTKSHVDSKSAIQDVYELLMSVFPVILLGYLSTMEYILQYWRHNPTKILIPVFEITNKCTKSDFYHECVCETESIWRVCEMMTVLGSSRVGVKWIPRVSATWRVYYTCTISIIRLWLSIKWTARWIFEDGEEMYARGEWRSLQYKAVTWFLLIGWNIGIDTDIMTLVRAGIQMSRGIHELQMTSMTSTAHI